MFRKSRNEERLLRSASRVYNKNLKHDISRFIANILFI